MKVDKRKLEIAMARACMSTKDVQAKTEMPRPTVNNAICGKNVRPETIGKIAKTLGVDVLEIIETEK